MNALLYIFKHLIFLLKILWKTICKFYRYLITNMFFFQNFILEHATA